MKLTEEDGQLLDELCRQNGVSRTKVCKLLDTVYQYEFKERRPQDLHHGSDQSETAMKSRNRDSPPVKKKCLQFPCYGDWPRPVS